MTRAVVGTICTTSTSTKNAFAPRRRKRTTAVAARKATISTITTADVTTTRLLRASSQNQGRLMASTKSWSVKWAGKKLGVREVISLLGSNADCTIQYTGNSVTTMKTVATPRHSHVIAL